MSEWVRVSFNGGEVERSIPVNVTPMTSLDESIKDWIRNNGMGFIRNYKILPSPPSED